MIKEGTLILFKVAYAASLILTATKTFDRVLSNFGQEVTFYKLGLNYSRASNFTQYNTTSFAECKAYFRTATVFITTFAEKQDNGVVLCTCFQTPIYYLPSVLQDEKPAFAFYKEQPNPSDTNWVFLQTNGKFYKRICCSNWSSNFLECNTSYPNGRIARPKTKVDIDSVMALPFADSEYIVFDFKRTTQTPYAIVWGDGTPLNKTEDAIYFSITPTHQQFLDSYECCFFYHTHYKSILFYYPKEDVSGLCEIDPFGAPYY